jgi:tetratricopeptide (TPR) repeat protein
MDLNGFDRDELLALARLDVERGQLEAALGKLKHLVAAPDRQPEALVLAARLYAQLGLMPRAQQLFEMYIAAKPDALHERFELGMTYFDSGKADRAVAMWSKVLESQPTHPPALFYTGLASAQAGKLADAKRSLDILMKSAATDNLYFSKGKELLSEIDQGLVQATQARQGTGATPSLAAHSYLSTAEH